MSGKKHAREGKMPDVGTPQKLSKQLAGTAVPAGVPGMDSGGISKSTHILIAAGIGLVVWLVMQVCLGNRFTDWDDAGYIVNNPLIRDISAAGLKRILSEPVMGNYHPLTILSYALEYSLVELEPWLYHFDSLLLHVLVTISVYWFVILLTGRPVAAVVTALLFGLSPMHVESAAWIAGRKDLFCALFYIGACCTYVYYLHAADDKKRKWFIVGIILFLFALLSKPVAVTLPVVLLLIDGFEKRTWTVSLLIEKIPHFVLSLIAGIISVKIQHGGGAMDAHKVHYNFIERVALGCYALLTYLWKALIPAHLCNFYPYPPNVNGSLPYMYYLAPLLVIAVIFAAWKYCRKNRMVVFGFLFFMVTIILVLQFIPVGDAIVAERYSYMPYIGLFLIIGWLVAWCFESGVRKQWKDMVAGGIVIYLVCLCYVSHERCKVWYDATTLWTDEIAKEPANAPVAYNNLGFIYFTKSNTAADPAERQAARDSAFYLMQKAVELDTAFVNAYQGLGMIAYMRGNFASSAGYFRTAVRLAPTAENHGDYANVLIQEGKVDSALSEYNTAVLLNPELYVVRLNRGKLFKNANRWEEAFSDLNKAVALNPSVAETYYLRSYCFAQKGDKAAALQDVEKALSLGYTQVDNNYYQGLKQ